MYKSNRYEFSRNPYWDKPNKDFRKFLNKQHRTVNKKIISKGVLENETKD